MQLGTLGKLHSVDESGYLQKYLLACPDSVWQTLKEHCGVEKPNREMIKIFLTWATGTKDWPRDCFLTGLELIGYLKIFADCVPTVK